MNDGDMNMGSRGTPDDACRATLRASLMAEMDQLWARRRRRHRMARHAMIPVLTVGAAGYWMLRETPATQTHDGAVASAVEERGGGELRSALPAEEPGDAHAAIEPPAIRIARVQTDPAILDRYRVEAQASVTFLSDAQLAQALSQSGIQTGVMRVGNEVRLAQPGAIRRSQSSSHAPEAAHFSAS